MKRKTQVLFSVFFRVCAFLLDSVFVTNLGLNKNHFCLSKVLTVTALLPKFCSCRCSLYAKLLTATRKEKAQICKSHLSEILYILFCITLLHCCQFLPAFTIFFFQANVIFKEYIQLANVENETHCPKNKVSSVMSFIYLHQLAMYHQPQWPNHPRSEQTLRAFPFPTSLQRSTDNTFSTCAGSFCHLGRLFSTSTKNNTAHLLPKCSSDKQCGLTV